MKYKLIILAILISMQFLLISMQAINIEDIKNIQNITKSDDEYTGELPNNLGELTCKKYVISGYEPIYICILKDKNKYIKAESSITCQEIYRLLEEKYQANSPVKSEKKHQEKKEESISPRLINSVRDEMERIDSLLEAWYRE